MAPRFAEDVMESGRGGRPYSPTPYDHVTYPSRPFAQTRPHHLATVAALYGMSPAPPSKSRVLELGCGAGGNIVPMAYQSPKSEYVGIDLSRTAIEAGQRMTRDLGLSNVSLQHRDIMDVSPADGRFDYIIAHGVYSWVPQAVRDKILSVFAANLTPHGVAYVSYNALPGSHLRNLVRSILHFHVRGVTDPLARAAQSRKLMQFLASAAAEDQIYGFILRDQQHRIGSLPDEVFIHDDLDEGSTPFFLYQVVEAAARHGLQYLADSDFPIRGLRGRSEDICRVLSGLPEAEIAVREQYLDFIDGRSFRASLFCHHEAALNRPADRAGIKRLSLSGALEPADPMVGLAAADAAVFKTLSGATLRTNQPLSKAALVAMAQAQPQAIAFDDLVARALSLLGGAAPVCTPDEIDALAETLFEAVRTGLIEAYDEPPRLTTAISERPKASGLARWQLATGAALVTNLLHGAVQCEDSTLRCFIPLVDGTRTVEELRGDLQQALDGAPETPSGGRQPITIEAVQRSLEVMARLALLEA